MKSLWKDRRGNVLAITAGAIPLVVGSAGLATDTIQWVTWKRELQRAADSAAIAGVLARAAGATTVDTAVTYDLSKNQTTGISLESGYPQITYPTSSGYTKGVQVRLAIKKRLGFSSMFLSATPTITTTATAALIQDGEFCLYALENGSDPGITVSGSSTATIGCNAQSNSNGNPSVQPNGNAYTISAPMMSGAGNMPTSITGVTEIRSYQMPQPDPFENLYPTDIPSGTTCRNFSQNSYTTSTGTGQDRVTTNHLPAGCYTSFAPSGNATYYLDPGVYYLNNADFDIRGGATLIGTDVTIILTGTTPGSIKTNGNSTIQLTAPTSGTYDRMLFVQSNLAEVDNLNEINGSNTSMWDGAFYFPKGKVTFTGSSGTTTRCVMVVAKKLDFNGNANVQNDVTGCQANKRTPRYVVRLVA